MLLVWTTQARRSHLYARGRGCRARALPLPAATTPRSGRAAAAARGPGERGRSRDAVPERIATQRAGFPSGEGAVDLWAQRIRGVTLRERLEPLLLSLRRR